MLICFQVLKKLQVTPYEAEPCIPQYFVRENAAEVMHRREFIKKTLKKLGHEPVKPQPLVLTEQQAVIIIQSHERARQGRLRYKNLCPTSNILNSVLVIERTFYENRLRNAICRKEQTDGQTDRRQPEIKFKLIFPQGSIHERN